MAQRVFFSRRRALLPRVSVSGREREGGGGDERRRGGPQDPFCRARILGARCSLYAYPPPPTRRSFLPRSRLRNPRIIIAALSETREG